MGRRKNRPVEEVKTQEQEMEEEESSESSSGEASTKDRSNPPYYVVIGINPQNGATQIVWKEKTIGRVRKAFANVVQGFGGVYRDLSICRVKRILDTDNGEGE